METQACVGPELEMGSEGSCLAQGTPDPETEEQGRVL